MFGLDQVETLFVIWSIFFQIVLIIQFILRKWAFDAYIWRFGWIVYALGLPAAGISVWALLQGKPLWLGVGGFIYLVFEGYGYYIEYIRRITWRSPICWSGFGPYLFLYLAMIMFYWWPLALLWKPLGYAYALLFGLSTALNLASHHPAQKPG